MIRDQNPEGNDGTILEYYTMDDIDRETLRKYRQIFEIRNDGHVWNSLDDKAFLEQLGGYNHDAKIVLRLEDYSPGRKEAWHQAKNI